MATKKKSRPIRKASTSKAGAAKARKAKAVGSRLRPRQAVARAAKPARRPAARKVTAPSAADAMRALARRIVALTVANDDEATLALYAADVESVEMGQPPMRGLDALRAKFAGWRNMVTDAKFAPRRVCVDGNTIVIEWVGSMTLAGSGKKAEMHEVAIHEIRDGKIAREAYFYNPAAIS